MILGSVTREEIEELVTESHTEPERPSTIGGGMTAWLLSQPWPDEDEEDEDYTPEDDPESETWTEEDEAREIQLLDENCP